MARVVQPRRIEDSNIPLQIDVDKEDLQKKREPERRDREPEEAEGRERVVEDGVLANRGVDADRDSEQERQSLREQDHLPRVPERSLDVRPERLRRDEGGAELVLDDVLPPV